MHPQVARDQFQGIGTLEAQEIIEVVSELDAVVQRMPFAEGQPVGAGQVLAELDDREYRADAARAEAQREQAQVNFERASKLSEQKMVSAQDLDNAHAALKVAEANESFAKTRLDKTRIRAPWAGSIGRRRVSPGAYLRRGDPVAELARIDRMKVSFATPERYLAELRVGIPLALNTPAYPGRTFSGHVTVVDPIIDPNTRTVQLVAQVENTERMLRPGMSANVTVTFAERSLALVVPDEAVFAEGAQSFVYVVKPDSTVSRVAIETGTRDSAHVEVVAGLEAGMIVVRAGHQKLYEGARVMPVSEQMAAAGGGPGAAGAPGATAASPGSRPGAAQAAPSPESGKAKPADDSPETGK